MHDVDARARDVQTPRDLQMTSWIRGRHPDRTGCDNIGGLASEQALRLFRLGDGVYAGTAATPRRFKQLDERHARQKSQQRARLARDLLSVNEMTRFVIRNARGFGKWWGFWNSAPDLDQPFLNVPDLPIPQRGAFAICRVIMQQGRVAAQVRAASASIGDNRVVAVGRK